MPWLILVLAISLFIALARGGRVTNLADIELRLWWLLILGFVIQAVAGLFPSWEVVQTGGPWILVASYIPIVVAVAANREKSGMWLAGVGILMNLSVIIANQGMPVLAGAITAASDFTIENPVVANFKHVPFDEDTMLGFLADVIPLRIFGQGHVISLGDVLLAIGLGRFLEGELRKPVRWFKGGVGSTESGSAFKQS
jgi:hypothetical protein